MMTPRERFNAVMDFKKPDILPWLEWFDPETVIRWGEEGCPILKMARLGWIRSDYWLFSAVGFKGFDPNTYFGCQSFWGCSVPVDLGPLPRFPIRIIREDEKYEELISDNGAVVRLKKGEKYFRYQMPMYLDFPVKDGRSWEEYKERLDPHDIRRYPKDWDKDIYIEIFEHYQNGPTTLLTWGFYGFGAQLMGIPSFNLAFYKDPELIRDMLEYWEYFIIETLRDGVETLKNRIDIVYWWEDMAENHGPFISPRIFEEFFLPHYKRVIQFFKKNRITHIMVDSDGNINPLIDLLIEAGINGLWPLEVNAGMDAVTIRKKYGKKLFVGGNLDKRKIMKGGNAMKKEIDSKLPILKKLGGYFPSIDHLVSPEFSYDKFLEYKEYLKKYL